MLAMRLERSGALATVVLTGALAFCQLGPQSASATPVPTSSAQARIELAPALRRTLRKDGVTVRALAPAAVQGLAVTLSGDGSFDPITGQATIDYKGGLTLRRGGRAIQVSDLELDTTAGVLDGNLGYGEIPLAATALISGPEGFGAHVSSQSLVLTRAASQALRDQLRLPAKERRRRPRSKGHRRHARPKRMKLLPTLIPGQSLGAFSASVQPNSVGIVAGGGLSFTLDPTLAYKLADLGVRTSGKDLAGEPSPGAFLFSVTSGSLALPGNSVTVTAGGILQLTQSLAVGGGSTVEGVLTLSSPSLDLVAGTFEAESAGSSSDGRALGFGELGRIGIGAIVVPPGALTVDPAARTVGLAQGVSATLSTIGAETLDGFRRLYETTWEEARPQDQIKAGEPLGTVSLAARTD